MPTFNQLVRKERKSSVKKSTAPALQRGFNSQKGNRNFFSTEERRLHGSEDCNTEEAEFRSP